MKITDRPEVGPPALASSSRGVCFVAFGRPYFEQCRQAVASLRRNSELPVVVCTDQEAERGSGINLADPRMARATMTRPLHWSHLEPEPAWGRGVRLLRVASNKRRQNRQWKMRSWAWSPFDLTLVLDTDIEVISPKIVEAFGWMGTGTYDVLFGRHWRHAQLTKENLRQYILYNRAVRLLDVDLPATIYKGGCWLFRRTLAAAEFLATWEQYWTRLGSGRDMPALMVAAQYCQRHAGLEVGLIPDGWEHHTAGENTRILHAASGHNHPGILEITKHKPDDRYPPTWRDVPAAIN